MADSAQYMVIKLIRGHVGGEEKEVKCKINETIDAMYQRIAQTEGVDGKRIQFF
jgi:hypothetical protein